MHECSACFPPLAGNLHYELFGRLTDMCPNQKADEEQHRGGAIQTISGVEKGEELSHPLQNGIVFGLGSGL